MILQIFSVYDSAVGSYGRPFFFHSKGEATRAFIDIANDPQSGMAKHPADYTLFHIGEFDDENADMRLLKTMNNLGKALEHQTPKTDNFGLPLGPGAEPSQNKSPNNGA